MATTWLILEEIYYVVKQRSWWTRLLISPDTIVYLDSSLSQDFLSVLLNYVLADLLHTHVVTVSTTGGSDLGALKPPKPLKIWTAACLYDEHWNDLDGNLERSPQTLICAFSCNQDVWVLSHSFSLFSLATLTSEASETATCPWWGECASATSGIDAYSW